MHGASLADSLQKPLPDAKRIFSEVIDLTGSRLALTVYSADNSEIALGISN